MRSAILRVGALLIFVGLLLVVAYIAVRNRSRSSENPPSTGEVVLYDQYSSPNFYGIASQHSLDNAFEDAETADDFYVPEGQVWVIQQVEVAGDYFNGNGPAISVNVRFYKSAQSRPGDLVSAQPDLTYTLPPPDPIATWVNPSQVTPIPIANIARASFLIPIEAVTLPTGRYWVSVQANIYFFHGGDWAWQARKGVLNQPAKWKSENRCQTWDIPLNCLGYEQDLDTIFRLDGMIVSEASPQLATPTSPPPTETLASVPTPTALEPTATPAPLADTPTPDALPTDTPQATVRPDTPAALPTNSPGNTPTAELTSTPPALPTATATATTELSPTCTPTLEAHNTPTIQYKAGFTPIPATATGVRMITPTATETASQKQPPRQP